ncbi:primase 1D-like protein [Bradyrhizobium ottawaense]|uniref:primase 1D-like protein n=1 Tax=Bradyrhizobium ottawaense TaxID=931866 RepID=UPI003F9F4866
MANLGTSVIGYEAPRFIELLFRDIQDVDSIKFFRPPSSSPIQQEPMINEQEKLLINQALELRQNLGLPFWDSLFLHLSTHPTSPPVLLKRALLHNPQDVDSFHLSRGSCTELRLREIIAQLPRNRVLAISSRLTLKDGSVRHLPMLDFHCIDSSEHEPLIKSVLAEIGIGGYLVASGRSYHFYGNTLVDEESLIAFLGKALLFSPLVDRAWIAHQLIERACGLRISPGKDYLSCPTVVGEIQMMGPG